MDDESCTDGLEGVNILELISIAKNCVGAS